MYPASANLQLTREIHLAPTDDGAHDLHLVDLGGRYREQVFRAGPRNPPARLLQHTDLAFLKARPGVLGGV